MSARHTIINLTRVLGDRSCFLINLLTASSLLAWLMALVASCYYFLVISTNHHIFFYVNNITGRTSILPGELPILFKKVFLQVVLVLPVLEHVHHHHPKCIKNSSMIFCGTNDSQAWGWPLLTQLACHAGPHSQ